MDENERAEMAEKFADMDEEAFQEYMQEEEQHQQQQQQEQNQKNQQNAMSSYIAYQASGYGRHNLYAGFTNPDYVCETCEQSCEDGHMNEDEEEYYKELENMFENGVCIQLGEYLYAGPTCGADGQTIEMGVFSDQYCTSMVKDSAYGYMDNINLGGNYMALLQDLYENPFSCSMGMQFDYRAAYENVSFLPCHLIYCAILGEYSYLPLFDTHFIPSNNSRTKMQNLRRHVKDSLNTPFPNISATTATSTTSTTSTITIMRPPRKETSGPTRTSRPIVLRFLSNKPL